MGTAPGQDSQQEQLLLLALARSLGLQGQLNGLQAVNPKQDDLTHQAQQLLQTQQRAQGLVQVLGCVCVCARAYVRACACAYVRVCVRFCRCCFSNVRARNSSARRFVGGLRAKLSLRDAERQGQGQRHREREIVKSRDFER